MKEVKEIRQKGEKELSKLLKEKKEELRKLRFQSVQGKLSKNHLIKKSRTTISHILTVLNEKKVK